MKKQFIISLITACVIIAFSSCSGTINTRFQPNVPKQEFKKAFIISSENSGYIRQKFPIITPLVVVFPGDDPAEDHKTIGNTAEVIKQELEKRNIECTIGKRGETPENTDLIVMYSDVWRWDMKKILDNLVIVFVTPPYLSFFICFIFYFLFLLFISLLFCFVVLCCFIGRVS